MTDSSATESAKTRKWMVSPWFDLCFVINAWWLLFYLLPETVSLSEQPEPAPIRFWQIYFLTVPHRWLTLFLVATDPDRREGRTGLFVGIAVVAAVAVTGIYSITQTFFVLALIDYVWNGYHFAAQHAGISRIYGRMGGGGRGQIETIVLRTFITYTTIRLASWSIEWTKGYPIALSVVQIVDLVALGALLVFYLSELLDRPLQRPGKILYLTSITFLYSSLLLAIRSGGYVNNRLVMCLLVASAAFHAVEYMAIVTFYAWRRRETGSESPFRTMAGYWINVLVIFILIWALIARYADQSMPQVWYGINLWASYLHYAFDGMIWKLRRKDTAKALNVE